MKNMLFSITVAVVGFAFADGAMSSRTVRVHDRILSRAESYFGVHFDFHAEMDDPELGGNTTPEKVREILDIVRPDYVEIDTKGHPGVSSYPTAVGNHAGKFARDPLKVWRDETAKAGVALYAHHSSVLDRRACELHPEWAALAADGKRMGETVSLLGPYADELLIPQLKEIACVYGLDGAWIDGDCWGVAMDYSPAVKARFMSETGLGAVPCKPGEPGWVRWREFNRELFRRFVKKYVAEVKKVRPSFQFCSNGAFSSLMPELPFGEIDFISHDVFGQRCVDAARYLSRLLATQGKPWDLMSWSFVRWQQRTLDDPATRKPAVQLQREAACIIAQGGGYQAVFSQAPAGYPPKRDGSIDVEKIRLFADVRAFCMERKPFCFKARPVPQIGVLLSTAGSYAFGDAKGTSLFNPDNYTSGIVMALADNHRCVSVLLDSPKTKYEDYPVIAVCEWDVLEDGLPERLESYVRSGGRLFVSGSATAHFRKMLADAPRRGNLHIVGKGAVFATDVPVSRNYCEHQTDETRRFLATAFDELDPGPTVRLEQDLPVDLSLMRTAAGELAVHLVNVSGDHRKAELIHSIDPVLQVPLSIRLPARPKSVRIEPGRRDVEWKWVDGKLSLVVPCVPIHEIVVCDIAP